MNSLPYPPAPISPAGNTVELIEFGDFTSVRCRQIRVLMSEVLTTFNDRINYSYRHFFNTQSEASLLAALAAEAARRQGVFWPMNHALFRQPGLSRSTLSILAINFGIDCNQFLVDLDDEQLRRRVEADVQEGYRLGVTNAPTLFVNGQQFHGKLTHSRLASIIRSHLSRPARFVLSRVDQVNGIIYWGDG